MNDHQLIADAEREIDIGEVARAHEILQPLLAKGNAGAVYIAGTISKPGETDEEFEKRHVEYIRLAANMNHPKALYHLGCYFDIGEGGFEVDTKRASELFKQAADLGHLRSKWIHACELLWGNGSYEQNIFEGLKYLNQSAEDNFVEALETLARIYENGEFGYEKNATRAAELRKQKDTAKD